jgi:hypothetical protein
MSRDSCQLCRETRHCQSATCASPDHKRALSVKDMALLDSQGIGTNVRQDQIAHILPVGVTVS